MPSRHHAATAPAVPSRHALSLREGYHAVFHLSSRARTKWIGGVVPDGTLPARTAEALVATLRFALVRIGEARSLRERDLVGSRGAITNHSHHLIPMATRAVTPRPCLGQLWRSHACGTLSAVDWPRQRLPGPISPVSLVL